MRLLQLLTGPDELIDLHPHVTVVAGLDDGQRRLLTDTVSGLAHGTVPGRPGLLEAHGVLFDLTPEMLRLLDVQAGDLDPIVTAEELPAARRDHQDPEQAAAERTLAEVEARWIVAQEAEQAARAAREVAAESLDVAQRAVEAAAADASGRIASIDALTAHLDQVAEDRRRLSEELAGLEPEQRDAEANRADVEAATSEVRARRQQAATACSEVAGELDAARLALTPDALVELDAARAALEALAAEIEAEGAAGLGASTTGGGPDGDQPGSAAERLVRLQEEIEAAEKGLAAFVALPPPEAVTRAMQTLRRAAVVAPVPDPRAAALADELALLEVELVSTEALGGTPGAGLAERRVRLEEARHALLEAELAVRHPEVDRDAVDRLETVHAELLDAIDRADGRFGGARAQRRVDTLRAAEQEVLDEVGYTSYSDYMMGSSLLHVDPAKEATLEAARAELSAAEDAWRALEAETNAELARAERLERRRRLIEEARQVLGQPVPPGRVVEELRGLTVPGTRPPGLTEDLRAALDDAGVALGDDELDADDLLVVAEAWIAESFGAARREATLREELERLGEERRVALEAVAAEEARASAEPEVDREGQLAAARRRLADAEAQVDRHCHVETEVVRLTEALGAAADLERGAAEAAAEADELVAEAVQRVEELRARRRQVETDLADAARAEVEGNALLRAHTDEPAGSPEEMEAARATATADLQEAEARLAEATAALEELAPVRQDALDAVAARADAGDGADASLAEEVEWYLLARLAAQRSVSLAGSLPLVLDDALAGLDQEEIEHVLGRLERMAEAVQVIVVSDDPHAAAWAHLAGSGRAAVVRPQPVSAL